MHRHAWVYLVSALTLVLAAVMADGCGGSSDVNVGDGGSEGGLSNGGCGVAGAQCSTGTDCCSGTCDSQNQCYGGAAVCGAAGAACKVGTDCCSQSCTNGKCGSASCTPDDAACTTSAQCCGGNCASGKCVPLSTTCKTSGNPCTQNSDCCSTYCSAGLCQNPSYCVQSGDVCSASQGCCSQTCNIASGATLGTCGAAPTGASFCNGGIDGTVCGACNDCCSRLCAPYANTGVDICQPANGCHVDGDLCTQDSDCCGGESPDSGIPGAGNVTCQKQAGATIGICRNPTGCNPEGDVCHYQNYACSISSARNDCCGAPGNSGACQLDKNGVPRCLAIGCQQSGAACAFDSDCCNGVPCVPAGPGGSLICGTGGSGADGGAPTCVPTNGPCTVTGDCCNGLTCNVPPGSTQGTCGAPPPPPPGVDAGTAADGGSCAFFGQACLQTSDCCNAPTITCVSGFCSSQIR
jgi:hypothetical protein